MPFKKRTAMRKAEKEAPMSARQIARQVLPSLCFALLLGLVLLLVVAAVLGKTKDPGRYAQGAGLAVLYVSALAGGGICTLRYGKRTPFLCGLLLGTAFFLLTLALSFAFPQAQRCDRSLGAALLLRALLIPTAIVGAFLAARQKKRPRRRRS